MNTTSHWIDSAPLPPQPTLDRDLEVEVIVVGAGLTGITTAYLLKQAGHSVALVERGRCAEVDTGHTTAHLTAATDKRLHPLAQQFGRPAAQAVWEAGTAGIQKIFALAQTLHVDCDFQWVPGILHAAPDQPDAGSFEQDFAAATESGISASLLAEAPFFRTPGLLFANQAHFHPRKYLGGLLARIGGDGSYVFENSEVAEITDAPLTVRTRGGRSIRATYLVLATHNPLTGVASTLSSLLLQTKLALYTSYALGAQIPKNRVPDALFWDTADPYHYLRLGRRQATHDYVIFGGADHKTGQVTDTIGAYRSLEEDLLRFLPEAVVDHRWSGQVIETNDGLPFIGEFAPKQFIATGYSGNGMTFGTVAALMALDAVEGRRGPWVDLFDPHRKKIFGGTLSYLAENKDYPVQLARDLFERVDPRAPAELAAGEAAIVRVGGHKAAAYRDEQGNLSVCSAICPHLFCTVAWNPAERTWDCPCHGSRFQPNGEVLSGPAEEPLKPLA